MDKYQIAKDILGMPGRMLSASKSDYSSQNLGHIVVFNGNVCTEADGKIWFGDLDVSKDEDKVKALAEALGEKIYVLYEMDARFENEAKPLLDRAVYETF